MACAESRIFKLLCAARNREKQKRKRKVIRDEEGLVYTMVSGDYWLVEIIVAPVFPCIGVFLTCYVALSCNVGLELK